MIGTGRVHSQSLAARAPFAIDRRRPGAVERSLAVPGGGSLHEPAIWERTLVFLRRNNAGGNEDYWHPRARLPDRMLSWQIGDVKVTRVVEMHTDAPHDGPVPFILDATPDFLLPELQTATTLDGRPQRKIAVAMSASDPRDDDDPMWVKMDTVVQAQGGQ